MRSSSTLQWDGGLLRGHDLSQAGGSYIRSMRRLLVLTPLLLLGACGSSDLTFTSEVGEKVIIKKETIKQISDSSSEEMKASRARLLARDRRVVAESAPGDMLYEEAFKSMKALETVSRLNETGIWYKEYRYVPISVDLNGVKTVGKESYVICVDQSLTPREREVIGEGILTQNIVQGQPGDPISAAICSEFASFDRK